MPFSYYSGEESSSRNYSTSGSRQMARSEGGERYTPEQLSRINRIYADISSRLASMGQPLGFASYFGSVGGAAVPFPAVTAGAVYTPEAIQQQVNLLRAQNAAQAAEQTRQMQERMAGRGYSAQSPLALALQAGFLQQALAASTEAENLLRFNAQRANAEQLLRQQIADVQRANLANQADVNRRSLALSARGQDLGREQYLLQALEAYNRPLRYEKAQSRGESFSFATHRGRGRSGRGGTGYNMRNMDFDLQY